MRLGFNLEIPHLYNFSLEKLVFVVVIDIKRKKRKKNSYLNKSKSYWIQETYQTQAKNILFYSNIS